MSSKPKKLTPEALKRLELMAAKKPGLMEYAHHVGSFSIEKLNQEEMKNSALQIMHQQTEIQLGQIYEQVELLAKQALKIKERSNISRRIYKAKISFQPVPGNTYFLYQKKNNDEIISLISPDEWGTEHSDIFIAKIKLLADYTWMVESVDPKENK